MTTPSLGPGFVSKLLNFVQQLMNGNSVRISKQRKSRVLAKISIMQTVFVVIKEISEQLIQPIFLASSHVNLVFNTYNGTVFSGGARIMVLCVVEPGFESQIFPRKNIYPTINGTKALQKHTIQVNPNEQYHNN